MLVLSRKAGESIRIGNDVTITVHRVAGQRISIAIDAPAEVRIMRGELQAALNEFQQDAGRAEKHSDAKTVHAA